MSGKSLLPSILQPSGVPVPGRREQGGVTGMGGTGREGAQPPRCPPGSADLPGQTGWQHPPARRDGHGEAASWVSSPPSPAAGLVRGFAGVVVAPPGWELAQALLAATFLLLLLPPMAGDTGVRHPWGCSVRWCSHAVPCCATPYCAQRQSPQLKIPARSYSDPHSGIRGRAQPRAPIPASLPSPHPSIQPRGWPDPCVGSLGGGGGRGEGKGWSRLPPDQGLWSLACLDAATHT